MSVNINIIFNDGVAARANNKDFLANPYIKPEMMPAVTRESVEPWNEKRSAWNDGWKYEDFLRNLR